MITLTELKERLTGSNEALPSERTVTESQLRDMTDLERLVVSKTEAHRDWCDAKKVSDGIKAAYKPWLAQLGADIRSAHAAGNKTISAAALEQEASSRPEVIDYIVGMTEADRQTNRLRARFEGLKDMWESARTDHADKRQSHHEQGVF